MCKVINLEKYKQKKEIPIISVENRENDELVSLKKALDIIKKILKEKYALIEENKNLKSELLRRKNLQNLKF